MQIDFKGKTALVTGAGRGIGRATAVELVKCGASVIALGRTEEHLKTLQQEIPTIKIVCVDINDWKATKEAVEALGTIDLLVNNAGIAILESCLDTTEENLDTTFGVNVKAVINISQVVARGLIKEGKKGAIVNLSSVASKIGILGHLSYGASKGALDQVTRNFALELGPHNIRVNAVNPTVVWTDMSKDNWADEAKSGPLKARIPQGKFVEVCDVVHPVLYLLSDKSDMINGTTVPIEGGLLCN